MLAATAERAASFKCLRCRFRFTTKLSGSLPVYHSKAGAIPSLWQAL
jgi:hypothetical protein